MFEHRSQPILSAHPWRMRVLYSVLVAAIIITLSLALGAVGYHVFSGLGWIDATLNAAMILTGMGPVDRMDNDAAKLFATVYSIFSGVVFLGTSGILVAPWAHRLLHYFHADLDEQDQGGEKRPRKGR